MSYKIISNEFSSSSSGWSKLAAVLSAELKPAAATSTTALHHQQCMQSSQLLEPCKLFLTGSHTPNSINMTLFYLVLDAMKFQPRLQLEAERRDWWNLKGEKIEIFLRPLNSWVVTYLGRPGELEEVDHVLLKVLHMGQRLLWFSLSRLLCLFWLLLFILLLLH